MLAGKKEGIPCFQSRMNPPTGRSCHPARVAAHRGAECTRAVAAGLSGSVARRGFCRGTAQAGRQPRLHLRKAKNVIFLWLQGGRPSTRRLTQNRTRRWKSAGRSGRLRRMSRASLLRAPAAHGPACGSTGRHPLPRDPRRQPRRERLLAADRLPVRRRFRQCPSDQADRTGLISAPSSRC